MFLYHFRLLTWQQIQINSKKLLYKLLFWCKLVVFKIVKSISNQATISLSCKIRAKPVHSTK